MAMQTDVKISQTVIPQFAGGVGILPLRTPDGAAIGSCRIKSIVVEIVTYNDGIDYGGIIQFASAKADGSNYKAVFSLNINTPGYAPAPTVTWLMPGEGLLVQDTLWWYSDSTNCCGFYVVYG